MRKIYVFDTTLRDGEQVPGAKMNLEEKVRVALQLERLGVDFMEVGFPSSSMGDFQAVQKISEMIQNSTVTALGRAVQSDIDCMVKSLSGAADPMIHIVLGSSDIHMDKKLRKTPEQIIQMGTEAVAYAKRYISKVEYSLEDASRSDLEYMWKTIESVVKAGATCVNIPDTVGIAVPEQFGEMIRKIHERLMNVAPDVLLSVHCHNDTGLATANTLAAVRNGANKVECTVNGIGERAGNTSLEEVVIGVKAHPEYYNGYTDIVCPEIYETSRMVSRTMGLDVQVNKAVVGENAFAHSSGIHQDGLLKSKDVYEIIEPGDVGAPPMNIVLTARSGKHAFAYVAEKIGYQIQPEHLEEVHQHFLSVADQKKEVYDSDVVAILDQERYAHKIKEHGIYRPVEVSVEEDGTRSRATVILSHNGTNVTGHGEGCCSPEAIFESVCQATCTTGQMNDVRVQQIGGAGHYACKAVASISVDGKDYFGKGIEENAAMAQVYAIVNGINKIDA